MEIVVRIDAEDALEGTEVGRAERGGDRDGGSVCDCDTRGGYAWVMWRGGRGTGTTLGPLTLM